MDFKEIFSRIFYGAIAVLALSGVWILLHWGFDMVTIDNPPTLMNAAQSFIDFWAEKIQKIPRVGDFIK